MPPVLHPTISGSSGSFSIIVAPSGILLEAFSTQLRNNPKHTLYLCGNYPEILPKLFVDHRRILIRRALTAYQILTILEEAHESLIFFEHDRTLFDDNPDLIPVIGEICRKKAEQSLIIILFSTRVDQWLSQIDPYANRVVYYLENEIRSKKLPVTSGQTQDTLEGIW